MHRYHAAGDLDAFLRKQDDVNHEYANTDCPGIDNPASQEIFPIIHTLLSIPFSLLGNLPRLTGLLPISRYQQKLITMSSEIIRLWWWDPSPDMKENLREIHHTKIRQPEPKPKPIHLISTTFSTAKPIVTYGTSTAHSSRCTPHHDARSVELPSGQILFDATPSVSLDRDGLLLSPAADELTSKGPVTSWLVASASGAWDLPTAEGADSVRRKVMV
jgi:hypothetical protein